MKILFDTSFICGFLDAEDAHNREASRLFVAYDGAEMIIPNIVVTEMLMIDRDGFEVIQDCKSISKNFLPTTDKELDLIATFPYSLRKTLKANDCSILALAISHRAHLITFDQKLQKAYDSLSL